MVTKVRTSAGKMDCLCCGREIPVKASENGTLNASCAWCDFTAYGKAGTESARIIMGKLKGGHAEDPAPAPATAPAPAKVQTAAKVKAPAPAPAPARTWLGI